MNLVLLNGAIRPSTNAMISSLKNLCHFIIILRLHPRGSGSYFTFECTTLDMFHGVSPIVTKITTLIKNTTIC